MLAYNSEQKAHRHTFLFLQLMAQTGEHTHTHIHIDKHMFIRSVTDKNIYQGRKCCYKDKQDTELAGRTHLNGDARENL